MNKHERVRAAFGRRPVDRVPVSFWRHFPEEDQTAAGLVKAVLAFQRRYDFDFVKVTPSSDYLSVEWGVQSEYRGSLEGTREVISRPIQTVSDWDKLRPIDPSQGSLGRQLETIRTLEKELGGEVPFLQTIFSPLAWARKIAGDRWREDMRRAPEVMHRALGVIAETNVNFVRETLRAGASGIFFAVQNASHAQVTEEEFRDFGQRYDLPVLRAAAGQDKLIILHLHGEQIMFDLASIYPVSAVNWHDRRTAPALKEALGLCSRGLIGGLNELGAMRKGTPADVSAEAVDAIAQTGGVGLTIGAGCVTYLDAPEENIRAAIAAARGKRGQ